MTTACVKHPPGACDTVPTDIETTDYFLHFNLPAGLMPDPQFDGRAARLRVHRVQPVYENNKCPSVANRAAVLIHGRSVSGPPTFDLQHRAPSGGNLSVQEALARAGIDTFAPSLLGYAPSTTFRDGLDNPGNASLPPYAENGSCSNPVGCDRTHNNKIFPLELQSKQLNPNPLAGQLRKHSSNTRFARTDVWVNDIRRVIDDAIAKAQPAEGKVALVGYSLGALRVGRALYNDKFPEIVAKVNRAVFLAPFFGGDTEEKTPAGGFVTFPLAMVARDEVVNAPGMSPAREAVCMGYRVAGMRESEWDQMLYQDSLAREWGGNDLGNPAGLVRLPTFSSNGFNPDVVGQLTPPTLVMQGLDDNVPPLTGVNNAPAIYNALPASMTNKVLVQIDCATHEMMAEGCSNAPRCNPPPGTTPYGGTSGKPWAGAHSTLKAALIEWINSGTFNGKPNGKFIVNASGVANRAS
jgi:pimeloyl-ACP methyl ester carboxylesterase